MCAEHQSVSRKGRTKTRRTESGRAMTEEKQDDRLLYENWYKFVQQHLELREGMLESPPGFCVVYEIDTRKTDEPDAARYLVVYLGETCIYFEVCKLAREWKELFADWLFHRGNRPDVALTDNSHYEDLFDNIRENIRQFQVPAGEDNTGLASKTIYATGIYRTMESLKANIKMISTDKDNSHALCTAGIHEAVVLSETIGWVHAHKALLAKRKQLDDAVQRQKNNPPTHTSLIRTIAREIETCTVQYDNWTRLCVYKAGQLQGIVCVATFYNDHDLTARAAADFKEALGIMLHDNGQECRVEDDALRHAESKSVHESRDSGLKYENSINTEILANIRKQIALEMTQRNSLHAMETAAVHVNHAAETTALVQRFVRENEQSLSECTELKVIISAPSPEPPSAHHTPQTSKIAQLHVVLETLKKQLHMGFDVANRARENIIQLIDTCPDTTNVLEVHSVSVHNDDEFAESIAKEYNTLALRQSRNETKFVRMQQDTRHKALDLAQKHLACIDEENDFKMRIYGSVKHLNCSELRLQEFLAKQKMELDITDQKLALLKQELVVARHNTLARPGSPLAAMPDGHLAVQAVQCPKQIPAPSATQIQTESTLEAALHKAEESQKRFRLYINIYRSKHTRESEGYNANPSSSVLQTKEAAETKVTEENEARRSETLDAVHGARTANRDVQRIIDELKARIDKTRTLCADSNAECEKHRGDMDATTFEQTMLKIRTELDTVNKNIQSLTEKSRAWHMSNAGVHTISRVQSETSATPHRPGNSRRFECNPNHTPFSRTQSIRQQAAYLKDALVHWPLVHPAQQGDTDNVHFARGSSQPNSIKHVSTSGKGDPYCMPPRHVLDGYEHYTDSHCNGDTGVVHSTHDGPTHTCANDAGDVHSLYGPRFLSRDLCEAPIPPLLAGFEHNTFSHALVPFVRTSVSPDTPASVCSQLVAAQTQFNGLGVFILQHAAMHNVSANSNNAYARSRRPSAQYYVAQDISLDSIIHLLRELIGTPHTGGSNAITLLIENGNTSHVLPGPSSSGSINRGSNALVNRDMRYILPHILRLIPQSQSAENAQQISKLCTLGVELSRVALSRLLSQLYERSEQIQERVQDIQRSIAARASTLYSTVYPHAQDGLRATMTFSAVMISYACCVVSQQGSRFQRVVEDAYEKSNASVPAASVSVAPISVSPLPSSARTVSLSLPLPPPASREPSVHNGSIDQDQHGTFDEVSDPQRALVTANSASVGRQINRGIQNLNQDTADEWLRRTGIAGDTCGHRFLEALRTWFISKLSTIHMPGDKILLLKRLIQGVFAQDPSSQNFADNSRQMGLERESNRAMDRALSYLTNICRARINMTDMPLRAHNLRAQNEVLVPAQSSSTAMHTLLNLQLPVYIGPTTRSRASHR